MTVSVTTEFREEFEAERSVWFRRRFLWYTGVIGGLGFLNLILRSIGIMVEEGPTLAGDVAQLVAGIPSFLLHTGAFFFVRRRKGLARSAVLNLVYWLLIIGGSVAILIVPLILYLQIRQIDEEAAQQAVAMASRLMGVVSLFPIFFAHLIASLFIPWTPREAIRPLVPLLTIYSVTTVAFGVFSGGLEWWAALLFVIGSPLVGVPGVLIAWWRHSRFRQRFSHKVLRRSYGEIKRELVDARRIHEALFPQPIDDGPVRFAYIYEPMRQIGGDFLFARSRSITGQSLPVMDVVVIDVTGHGISAALTVNRLAGEIEREFGEKPGAEPGEILHGLNAYLHHTLARHSVYATALCVRIDPNQDELIWASAGHPSAFLRTASGRIDRLDSTTLLLGACRADDFFANQQKMAFHPADSLLIYTDGATETRNHEGRMLRTEGMQRLVASIDPDANGGWCSALLQAVDEFRHGPVKDDTLIVEVSRP